MTKMDKDGRDRSGRGMDECCLIAESMIDELHQITISDRLATPSGGGRNRVSFKRKIMQQIRNARRLATVG